MTSFHSLTFAISSSSSMLPDLPSSPPYKIKRNLPIQKFSYYDHIYSSYKKLKKIFWLEETKKKAEWSKLMLLYFRIGKLTITSARIVLNHFNDLWRNIKPFDAICFVIIQCPTKWCRKMSCWSPPKWVRPDTCNIDTTFDLLM